ncbi:MAG TPA: 4-hydroxythreonine-4-phosphate dehydrogenase PdxA [Longimicrobiales bacterium]|nr:4-hydroxythreonine-4-phosphate dehydrogenase PdxA [Longimicrobiales bacterium]
MDRAPTRLAVTLGDPRGIGPEVAAAAVSALGGEAALTIIGPEGTAATPDVVVGRWSRGAAAEAGALAGAAIEQATALALRGEVDGIVTAPIDKAALAAAGYRFPGHTEMLQHLTGAPEVVMLMAAEQTRLGGALRVVLATTHLPLRAVPGAVTTGKLVRQGRLTARGLREGWGMSAPRLALCALNPHASDGGLFGSEEAEIMEPAVAALREEGVDASGPFPADTVFVRALRGEFDAVIAPYHDVGMAAFKTASFGSGVNVTLGLPFVRTSPDHGTALDIAGRGVADPSSMIAAVRLAVRLVRGTPAVIQG